MNSATGLRQYQKPTKQNSMKTIRILVMIGIAALAISSTPAADNPAAKADLAQLQGEWAMVSGTSDGREIPKERMEDSKRTCKGDETTVIVDGQLLFKARFTIDPSKKPKAIDYNITDGQAKGKKRLGIYEPSGDTVKFCFAAPGEERPTDFTSKSGDHRTSSEWKREKKQG